MKTYNLTIKMPSIQYYIHESGAVINFTAYYHLEERLKKEWRPIVGKINLEDSKLLCNIATDEAV